MKREFLLKVAAIIGLFCFFGSNANAQQQTVLYPGLGFPQYFSVPPGVTQITAEIVGSDGHPIDDGQGGKGAKLTATIAVTPGDVLTVFSGCKTGYGFTRGGNSGLRAPNSVRDFAWIEERGGGSSAIINQTTVLAVAGGGGTSGGNSPFNAYFGAKGGDAIPAAGNGGNGEGLNGGQGGAFGASSTGNGGNGSHNGTTNGTGGGGGGGKSYTNPSFINSSTLELFPGEDTESGYVKITYNGTTNGHITERCSETQKTYTVPTGVRKLLVTGIGGDGGGGALRRRAEFSSLDFSIQVDPTGASSGNAVISGVGAGYTASINVSRANNFCIRSAVKENAALSTHP